MVKLSELYSKQMKTIKLTLHRSRITIQCLANEIKMAIDFHKR